MKNYNFDDFYETFNNSAIIEEKHLDAGDTLTLNTSIIISIHRNCVITVEDVAKAKRAFVRSLRKSLNGKDN